MEEKEVWRDIVNFNYVFADSYHINNLGEVWSKDRLVIYKNGKRRFYKGKKLKQTVNANGYPVVTLTKNGYNKTITVHQLIATSFPEICGTWFPGAQIDHKDGDKLNNRAENLWYCTPKDNNNNPITIDRKNKTAGINRPDQSKTVLQFALDGTFVAEYPSVMDAQRQTGFSHSLIVNVCSGNRKSTGGYKWMYKSDFEELKKEAV